MLLGMMVVGASAADKTYADLTDSEKISNKEAVSLLVDLGIIEGKTDGSHGSFRHRGPRHYGQAHHHDADGRRGSGVLPGHQDRPDRHRQLLGRGYIKFCYPTASSPATARAIFSPTEPVTVVQAAKMLLVAVGYDATDRGYVGDNWSVNIMRDAQSATEWSRTSLLTARPSPYSTGSVRSLTKGVSA